jgi:hypothetical protein
MSLKYELDRVIRGELDDCERALRRGDPGRARRELDDAVTKLKRIALKVGHLELDARQG